MKTEDLDDILEELPLETIEQMLKEPPAWSSYAEFHEALEELREKQDDEREDAADSDDEREDAADPDDEPDVPSDGTKEDPEGDAPSVNGGENREPDESQTAPFDDEDDNDLDDEPEHSCKSDEEAENSPPSANDRDD